MNSRSPFVIYDFGGPEDSIAQAVVQESFVHEIDLPVIEELGEVLFDVEEAERILACPRLRFDQEVDIAVRPDVVAEDGSKDRQLPNAMPPASVGDGRAVEGDVRGHDVRRG